MKQPPLHVVLSRIQRLPLQHQIAHLQALIKLEKPFSVRRNELISVLAGKMLKQLKREAKGAA